MSKFKPNSRASSSNATGSPYGWTDRSVGGRTAIEAAEAALDGLKTQEDRAGSDRSDDAEEQLGGLQRIGFFAMLLYVFFRFSFLHEFISGKLGIDTHIIITLSVVCYVATLLSGRLGVPFGNKISWLWLAFGGFMAIATATSFWLGGSFPLLIDYLRTVLPVVVMIPALAMSKKDVGTLINTIGVACATTIFLGIINSDFKTGRMGIASANSEIQDSNDFAAHVILMLPALTYLTMRRGRSFVYKIAGAAFMGAGTYEILSTGSRGGFLSLVVTLAYVIFTGSQRVRVAILAGIPLLGLIALPFVPPESAARLKTLFSSDTNAAEAIESKESRIALLSESWTITMHHPLSGVGPGQFMDFQADSAKAQGHRGMWHVTHNAYTQVSSECGLPAAFCYLGALFSTFAIFWKCRKVPDPELALMGSALSVMLLSFGVCVFFLSLAYNVQFVTLGGIAIVVRVLLNRYPDDRTEDMGLGSTADLFPQKNPPNAMVESWQQQSWP